MDRLECQRRLESLKQEFQLCRSQFIELRDYVNPTMGFFDEQPNRGKAPNLKKLIDGTPTKSVRIMAAGMTSGLTSPSRPWFKLGLPDDDLAQFEPVREWLDLSQSRMMSVFAKSNIYTVLHTLYEELGTFGTGASMILDDFDEILRGHSLTVGEYFLGTSKAGRVNTFGKETWFTVGQLIEEFGIDQVSPAVRAAYDNQKLDQWIKVAHLIQPNLERKYGKADSKNMAFSSLYWEIGSPTETFLRQSGYEDFPVLAPRWALTRSGDYYGKGPSWMALGDIRMLQRMQADKLVIMAKIGNPPVQADSSVAEVNVMPGGVTRSTSATRDAGVRAAYQLNPDLQHLLGEIRNTQKDVGDWFYTDLFLMLAQNTGGEMTAREVAERHEEKLLMLGPVIERLEGELTDPLIDRAFNIMLRKGLVPPPPQELQGMDLKVEYISILAQAQKMVGTAAIAQYGQFLGEMMKIKPEIVDTADFDEMSKQYGGQLGVPAKIIVSDDKVAAIRAERQKAIQAQQQAASAQAMVQGAQQLSQTPLGQNSALDALLGNPANPNAGGNP